MTERVAPRLETMAARPVHPAREYFARELNPDTPSSQRHQEPKKRAN